MNAFVPNVFLQHRWLRWLAFAALCWLFGYVDAMRAYASAYHDGVAYLRWSIAITYYLYGWSAWLFLAPLILWFGRHFRFDQRNWGRGILVYVLVGLIVAAVRALFPVAIRFLHDPTRERLQLHFVTKNYVMMLDFMVGFVIFGLLLAFSHAVEYYKQYREEELRASQLETQLAQAQLQALKMQLHPHFLFNTLNSIAALQVTDAAAAQKMTARLGDFLRQTLENVGTQEVTLRREIEFLKCYLDIERVRFGQRLTTDFAIAPETLDARVPNLILQPLVENAIRHGIAARVAPGHIRVTSTRSNGHLRVEIQDNGRGLSEATIKEGIGLSNTRSRLQQLYGAQHQFKLLNVADGGLLVTLDIPFTT